MEPIGITVGLCIATTLIVIAAHFAWRQRLTLTTLRADARIPTVQRHYLLRQSQRRFFGSILLFILAGLLIGLLFLDFDPLKMSPDDVPQVDRESARQSARFLGVYVMSMLLILLVILVLAILDFWATARFSLQQRKQLLAEQQRILEADLWRFRPRPSD